MAGSTYGRMINNWLHDFASGTWAACILVIWLLRGRMPHVPQAASVALAGVGMLLFWLVLGAVALIIVTGGIRLRYWRIQGVPDELPQRRRALLIKHVLYLVVYGAGTVWAWYLVYSANAAYTGLPVK